MVFQRAAGMMSGGAFADEADALFARMSPAPSYRRKITINRTIRALIRDHVWDDLDALYFFAAETAGHAVLNWKGATFDAANSGATFTADRGFTGNGSSAYLTTGWRPGLGVSGQNDHTMGRWLRTAGVVSRVSMGAASGTFRITIQDDAAGFTLVDGDAASSGQAFATGSPLGNVAVHRAASGQYAAYQAGVSVGTKVTGSQPVTDGVTILALNADGLPGQFSAGQVSAAYAGKELTSAKTAALNDALGDYLADVGA